MQKIYVLDTNVLLHDPNAIYSFNEHKVIIPMTVLEELDDIKDRRDKDVSKEARIAIQMIDKLLANADTREIQEGVEIVTSVAKNSTASGTLSIFPDQLLRSDISIPYLTKDAQDNQIINTALSLQKHNPEIYVCLVTKDINMRLKAKGSGLRNVEDYRKDKILDDIDLLAKGREVVAGDFWDGVDKVDTLTRGDNTVHVIRRDLHPEYYPNMFVRDDNGFIGFVEAIENDAIFLRDLNVNRLMHQNIWGLTPRNLDQAMAFYLLQSADIDLSILTGPAGSGKTLLALAFGLHAIIEKKQYNKIIVARSTPPIAEDIGFLPGTEEEKMAPWLAAFDDNLEILHGNDESCIGSISYVKEKANIQFKSLNFMRGRSINNAYIIIDESQSLTQFQLKSIITRVGKNSKIVVLGNLAQIDNKYITPLTSGLTYIVEKFKAFQHAGIMHIESIERSRLAAFAEENL
ncbi:MAG: PhoH family protein [Pseudomonadales bacterium]|nr:PhoH family protein [Pseudomonadales bacterium]